MRASIVMATYNGVQYLTQQIDSILISMSDEDELLVVDDASSDDTVSIVQRYMAMDHRVRLLPDQSHKGILKNFSYGIAHASGDVIFLADQDDIWFPEKIPMVKKCFSDDPDLTCVLSDLTIINQEGHQIAPSFFKLRDVRPGFWANIRRNSYIGNAMAFRASMKNVILPIPQSVPMHDQWIGLLNEHYGKCLFLSETLGAYRRHGRNVTDMQHGSIISMVHKRMMLAVNLLKRFIKLNGSQRKEWA